MTACANVARAAFPRAVAKQGLVAAAVGKPFRG